MKQALIFPGQGAQTVGMGRDLTEAFQEAKQTFEEADDLLGFSLSSIAWEGPEEVLTETRHAQPALYVHSMAAYRVIQARIGEVSFAAGHSLGELSAHAAAGTYSFAEGLEAVRRRGELMFAVGEEVPGAMAAVLGLDDDVVVDLCKQAQDNGTVVVPANFNSPGQVVVSGSEAGVDWCVSEAPERGARKAVRLNVSGAFHSPLMDPILDAFRKIFAKLEAGELKREDVDERVLGEHLYTEGADPDLIIRTGGESRLSNFLLYQAAYSELFFTDVHFPSFRKVDFLRLIRSYQQRKRRFGR